MPIQKPPFAKGPLGELISAISEAQGRLALLSRLLHYAKDGLQDVSHQ